MFNEHNYSKAVIEKIPEFEELTGITVEYSSTPESNYFDKLNTSLSSRFRYAGCVHDRCISGLGVRSRRIHGAARQLHQRPCKRRPRITTFDDFIPAVVDGLKWDTVSRTQSRRGFTVGAGRWAGSSTVWLNNKNVFADKGLEVPHNDRRTP